MQGPNGTDERVHACVPELGGDLMKKTLLGVFLLATAGIVAAPATASADTIGGGTAGAFGASVNLTDQAVIPPTPEASVTAPPFGEDVDETAVPIDADPVAVNGTLIAKAAVHQASDLPTTLEQPTAAQSVAGPYNARGVGQIEDLEVLIDAVEADVPLLEADLVRGEAVAVCTAGAVSYSANSEVVNLVIGGQDPLSGPLNDLINQISAGLNASPLVDLVDVDVNVVTATATGASVDALVVTVLAAAGDPPLAQIRLGHAEVSGVGCGDLPECSDTTDNDGDGVIDADDPGCHSDGDAGNPDSYDPNDDSEADAPQCSDTRDNDGDAVIDAADPGCHTDNDATNPASYDPNDNDETDGPSVSPNVVAPGLPKTGGSVPVALSAALGAGALGLFALRRKLRLL